MDTLDQWQPDAMLTYGGQSFVADMNLSAQKRGITTVFMLHNFAYFDTGCFRGIDTIQVPSQYTTDVYRERLGIQTVPIAPVINEEKILATSSPEERKYVTFINPQPHKGVYVFARIAEMLAARRPDIPLLVVESRADSRAILQTGIPLEQLSNVSVMRNTPTPSDIYNVTKIVLMPSLWDETFGRVAVEAMMNGIPVLARGSLPEICGARVADASPLVFHIPKQHTPETRVLVSETEAQPWVDAIIELYDAPDHYKTVSHDMLARAGRWKTETLLDQYEQVFGVKHFET